MFTEALRVRRRALGVWTISVVGLVVLFAITYPTVRGQAGLDRAVAGLPTGVKAALGLTGPESVTSPAGYMVSQFFANVFPVLLMVFAIGWAARIIPGDEEDRILEFVLANPVSRTAVLIQRAAAVAVGVAVLVLACALSLLVLSPAVGLNRGIAPGAFLGAAVGAGLLALVHGTIALAVGAATGRRAAAIAASSAVATIGFVLQGIGGSGPLSWAQVLSPWHWYLATNPLTHGLGMRATVLPVLVTITGAVVAVIGIRDRDLG